MRMMRMAFLAVTAVALPTSAAAAPDDRASLESFAAKNQTAAKGRDAELLKLFHDVFTEARRRLDSAAAFAAAGSSLAPAATTDAGARLACAQLLREIYEAVIAGDDVVVVARAHGRYRLELKLTPEAWAKIREGVLSSLASVTFGGDLRSSVASGARASWDNALAKQGASLLLGKTVVAVVEPDSPFQWRAPAGAQAAAKKLQALYDKNPPAGFPHQPSHVAEVVKVLSR